MDFKPVLRFAAMSDIHIKDEPSVERERLEKALSFLSSYADASDYRRVDAVCITGDFANSGSELQMQTTRDILSRGLRPETELIITVAGHEFNEKNGGCPAAYERLDRIFGSSPDVHKVINGFHFIAMSAESIPGKGRNNYGPEKQEWLKNALAKAAGEDEERPIFFFQHPHPTNTCSGSICWGNNDLYEYLSVYPQVISFSGHSHVPVNDPRSIDQKDFTSCGTGSLSYFELDEFDKIYGTVPPRAHNCAQFLLVEADAQKRVRILAYDLLSDSFFPQEWSIPTAWERSSFIYNSSRPGSECAPYFLPDARAEISNVENGAFDLTVPQAAADAFYVNAYYVRIRGEDGKTVKTVSFWSEYYFADMPKTLTQRIDGLAPGKYELEIWAEGFWKKKSKNRLRVTVEL
ncbi:MAG: metallophosphoesterase [Clostridiales bacterium]|nr:metallophosphoesterase [Clostridiales bacterium]